MEGSLDVCVDDPMGNNSAEIVITRVVLTRDFRSVNVN